MSSIDTIFHALLTDTGLHVPGTPDYLQARSETRREIETLFSSDDPVEFGRFGRVHLPYTRMGAIDSLDLFGLDEIIIFLVYWANRGRYTRTLDVGANIGLHTIIMSRCGYTVTSFEPDPTHFGLLRANIGLNAVEADLHRAALSTGYGSARFTRVLGNTTGSHLDGSKDSYGDLQHFEVMIEPVRSWLPKVDLVKIDAEGHEREMLLSTILPDWEHTDAVIEVGSVENARAIFDHLTPFGLHLYAQQTGWERVQSVSDMPVSHHQGSLFISFDHQPFPKDIR